MNETHVNAQRERSSGRDVHILETLARKRDEYYIELILIHLKERDSTFCQLISSCYRKERCFKNARNKNSFHANLNFLMTYPDLFKSNRIEALRDQVTVQAR